MKNVREKLNQLQQLENEIPKLERAIDRMESYAQNPTRARHVRGYIELFDDAGYNPMQISIGHLMAYPGGVRELLQLRLAAIKEEAEQIREVLSVADRLFESMEKKS